MKIKLFVLSLLLAGGPSLKAQRQNRIGYIDMDYILENIPEYQKANDQLDKKAAQWRKEIEAKTKKIETLKEDLKAERPLLTETLVEERQAKIDYEQKRLEHYQQKRFGPNGDMIKQGRQIIKPVEDEVFNVIQEIGKTREYDFIFDSSSEAMLLFSARRHDISDQVLNRLNRSNKMHGRDRQTDHNDTAEGETPYKSVEQARLEKERRENRKARMERLRHERRLKMKKKRDSLIKARQKTRESRLN